MNKATLTFNSSLISDENDDLLYIRVNLGNNTSTFGLFFRGSGSFDNREGEVLKDLTSLNNTLLRAKETLLKFYDFFAKGFVEIVIEDNKMILYFVNENYTFYNISGDVFTENMVSVTEETYSGLNYFFSFNDLKNIEHKVDIFKLNYDKEPIEINGRCYLEYAEEEVLGTLKGSGLKIDLEANEDINFKDLYTEKDRFIKVKYYRDSSLIFDGWLDNEGLYQNFNSDKWIISLDCVDGLSFLNNLSYVNEVDSEIFTGKQKALEVVVNCLKRTRTLKNILINSNFYYSGANENDDILNQIYFNADRFVKEDKVTIMNCSEVLKSTLEALNLSLTTYNNNWVVYNPNLVYDNNSISFFKYNSEGVLQTPNKEIINFNIDLGSDINDFYPHYCNGNQIIKIKPSIGAFRINYKYGDVNFLQKNKNIRILENSANTNVFVDGFDVKEGWDLNYEINNSVFENDNFFITDIQLYLRLIDGGDTYYYDLDNNTWELNSIKSVALKKNVNATYNLPSIPVDSSFDVLYIVSHVSTTTPNSGAYFVENKVFFSSVSTEIKGENHSLQRNNSNSTNISKNKEVFVGDDSTDSYEGTIYESDSITPTTDWYRLNQNEETKPILQITGEERMKMFAKPRLIFEGDFFGYFNFLSKINLDGFDEIFMPVSYFYDCKENIISAKLNEIINNDLSDLSYEVTFEEGDVVEPTIKS